MGASRCAHTQHTTTKNLMHAKGMRIQLRTMDGSETHAERLGAACRASLL